MRAETIFSAMEGRPTREVAPRSSGQDSARIAGREDVDVFSGLVARNDGQGADPSRGPTANRPAPHALSDRFSTERPAPDGLDVPSDTDTSLVLDDTGTPPLVASGKEDGPQVLPGPHLEDGSKENGPQILPGPPVTPKEGQGPEVLPGPPVTSKEGNGPEVLPGPPVSPKEGGGFEVLPGPGPHGSAKKAEGGPQINPGPPVAAPAAGADNEGDAVVEVTKSPGKPSPHTQAEQAATTPIAPALAQRLMSDRNRTSNAAIAPEHDGRLKARLKGDGAAAALEAAAQSTVTPANGNTTGTPPSLSQMLATALSGQAAGAGLEGQLKAGASGDAAPALPPASSESAGIDALRAQQATPDRGMGLSTLSRATIETTAQIAAQIQNRLNGRTTRFEMALTPEGLGRVDVSLEIDADGRLAARLAFDNPAAATDLRARADELRRQLEQAGLHLGQDALEFTERDPSSRGDGFDGFRGFDRKAFSRASTLNDQADGSVNEPAAWRTLSLTPDRVDLKV